MRIAVIGRGLIGSAAAKYLARVGHDVVLIGPDEPTDKAAHTGVFASHYDEGRITRALDPDPFWSRLSRASIARYRSIEAESGVGFFAETGAMVAGPMGGDLVRGVAAVQAAEAIAADRLEGDALAARFPYLRFDADVAGFFEACGAGHLSPRNLVKAQSVLAQRAGAALLTSEASGMSIGAGGVAVATGAGAVRADRVLVAAGGFSNMVLGAPLPIRVFARTVAFFELDGAEAARLRGMPSLVYQLGDGHGHYLLPPIRYPNGKTYLKLGGERDDVAVTTADEIKAWFRGPGSAQVGDTLTQEILRRMPGLRFAAMHTEPCVTTFTDSDRPDIRHLDDYIAVAVAGCGRAAKCSDELGRMAAGLYPVAG